MSSSAWHCTLFTMPVCEGKDLATMRQMFNKTTALQHIQPTGLGVIAFHPRHVKRIPRVSGAIDPLKESGAKCSQCCGFIGVVGPLRNADGCRGRCTWTCSYPMSLRPQNQRFRRDDDLLTMLPNRFRIPIRQRF